MASNLPSFSMQQNMTDDGQDEPGDERCGCKECPGMTPILKHILQHMSQATVHQTTSDITLPHQGFNQKLSWHFECEHCNYKSFYHDEIKKHTEEKHSQTVYIPNTRRSPSNRASRRDSASVNQLLPMPTRVKVDVDDFYPDTDEQLRSDYALEIGTPQSNSAASSEHSQVTKRYANASNQDIEYRDGLSDATVQIHTPYTVISGETADSDPEWTPSLSSRSSNKRIRLTTSSASYSHGYGQEARIAEPHRMSPSTEHYTDQGKLRPFGTINSANEVIRLLDELHRIRNSGLSVNDGLRTLKKDRKTVDRFKNIYYLSHIDHDALIMLESKWKGLRKGGLSGLEQSVISYINQENLWDRIEKEAGESFSLFGRLEPVREKKHKKEEELKEVNS